MGYRLRRIIKSTLHQKLKEKEKIHRRQFTKVVVPKIKKMNQVLSQLKMSINELHYRFICNKW